MIVDRYFDLGTYRREVTTASDEARTWFDRGFILSYGFNHEEAIFCFREAIGADVGFALAYWGLAYALGCNYNKPWAAFDPAEAERSIREAFRASRTALSLADKVSAAERVLIEALPARYQSETAADDLARWNDDFADAMRSSYARCPDDLDVAAVCAESLMNRTPWALWDIKQNRIAEGADTAEILQILERAMTLPGGDAHPGILHLYLHAMEMSPFPERAMPMADALRRLVPDSGHLIHMPTHIDVLVGNYSLAISENSRAIEADRKYLDQRGPLNFYSLYRCHNYHFKIYGAMFAGQYRPAIETSEQMIATLPEDLLRIESPPMANWLEAFASVRQHVLVRFGKWDEILAQPLPQDPTLFSVTTTMIWYAKAVANSVKGDVFEARRCADRFERAFLRVPEGRYLFNNRCIDILAVGRQMMLGEIAYRERQFDLAFSHLRAAVDLDDSLTYDEPWGWMQPSRHALGALLLEQGRVDEAASVYRADLGLDPTLPRACQHPENIWSLKGYHECLVRQGRHEEAARFAGKLAEAEGTADTEVRFSCFCRKVA